MKNSFKYSDFFARIIQELLFESNLMKYIHFTILIFLLLWWDIGTKYLASTYLEERIPLLWDIIYLELFHNTGIAFSIAITGIFLKILTIVLIFGIIYYYFFSGYEERTLWKDISFALILAGAFGNAYERIFHGYVVDFIGVQYFSIFNIADSYITLWALLYWYLYLKETKKSSIS